MTEYIRKYGFVTGLVFPLLFGLVMAFIVYSGHLTYARLTVGVLTLACSAYAVRGIYRQFIAGFGEARGLPLLLMGYAVGEMFLGMAFMVLLIPTLLTTNIGDTEQSGLIISIAYIGLGYWCATISVVGFFIGFCAGNTERVKYITQYYRVNPFARD